MRMIVSKEFQDALSELHFGVVWQYYSIRKLIVFYQTITKNTALDFYRKKKRESELCDANNMLRNVKEDINYDIFESWYGFGEQMRQYMEEFVDVDIIELKYGEVLHIKKLGYY